MRRPHSYSPSTLDATRVLGLEIARSRRARRWTLAALAERAGISVNTLREVEKGSPTVAIGIVFELATLLGVRLFDADPADLPHMVTRGRERLAVLPASVRESEGPVDDDL